MKNIMVVTSASCGRAFLPGWSVFMPSSRQWLKILETWKSTSINTAYPVSIDH